MKLTNSSPEQRLTVRLKKDIKREYALRLFLDVNSEYGINRKELVLQMYETLLANGFVDEDLMLKRSPVLSSDAVSSIIKQNEDSFENSMREEEQSHIDDIDPNDFGGI